MNFLLKGNFGKLLFLVGFALAEHGWMDFLDKSFNNPRAKRAFLLDDHDTQGAPDKNYDLMMYDKRHLIQSRGFTDDEWQRLLDLF
ncbi:Oidioi.mRNA.OKI2018_I69.PAR.g9622.t1.cds [Oikopleura dioica]|uniref:Oidioi.mRNA.OKI2018_I69.PAR.g9622.t1.cds n=1 Tax=Oikopleura dioica TaxID=34765 RepID=A0ABN7RQ36_OIKDI|nr:Oidioi.mRNA.OKI2018_I69.PAR.g9622.t1.cds [Oikopleura dioica]